MRRVVLILTLVFAGSGLSLPARGQEAATGEARGVVISGALLFVAGAPAVESGGKIVLLVMPRFYYFSYSQLFRAGAQIVVRGSEFAPTALTSTTREAFMVVEELSIAGKHFTILRSPAGSAKGPASGAVQPPPSAGPPSQAGGGGSGPQPAGPGPGGGRSSGFGPPPSH